MKSLHIRIYKGHLKTCQRKVHSTNYFYYYKTREVPGSPVVRSPHFHHRWPGFNLWSGNYDSTNYTAQPKKIKIKEIYEVENKSTVYLINKIFFRKNQNRGTILDNLIREKQKKAHTHKHK